MVIDINLFLEIEKSFFELEKLFQQNDLKKFLCCSYGDLWWYHFGVGTWIRTHLLNENDALYQGFTRVGLSQKDEMSLLILQLFYLFEQTKPH